MIPQLPRLCEKSNNNPDRRTEEIIITKMKEKPFTWEETCHRMRREKEKEARP